MCEKVSVVVPVYNACCYLRKCLESIVNQTYTNIEVVLVDDGSSDGSEYICDEFAKRDNRVVVIHQPNGGVAAAYNKGLDNATGVFLVIVDNDDFLDENLIDSLLKEQKNTNADFVQGGYIFVNKEGKKIKKALYGNNLYTKNDQMVWDYLVTGKISHTMTGALIRKSLFDGVRFPMGALSGDIQVIPQLLHKCSSYLQVNKAFYYVTVNFDSVSRSSVSDDMYRDKNECTLFYEDFLKKYYPNFLDFLYLRKIGVSVLLYTHMTDRKRVTDIEQKKVDCIKIFRNNYGMLKKTRVYLNVPFKERVKFLLFSISPKLLMLVEKMYVDFFVRKEKK